MKLLIKTFMVFVFLGIVVSYSHDKGNQGKVGIANKGSEIKNEQISDTNDAIVHASQLLVKKELATVRIDEKVGNVLDSDLTFYNKESQPVSLSEFIGDKPLVLSFAYYSCTLICQFVLQGQVDVFNQMSLRLGKDFNAVTISFDDKDDADITAQMTEVYAEKVDSDGGGYSWNFLYGQESEIKSITGQLGFYYKFIEDSGEFAHSSAIYVITPEGKISRYFYGIQYNPFDLKMALIESKDEKTRTTSERILMYCYQYDSDSRGYALEARRVMKAGGVITVVAMGVFFLLVNRKRKIVNKT